MGVHGDYASVRMIEEELRALKERIKGLEAAEERYRTIVRTAMNGFLLVGKDGRVLDANDAYCRMSGYVRDELLGMSITDLEAAETREETAARIARIIKDGHDTFETSHYRKDGKTFDLEVCATYLASGDGEFFVFFKDITESKRTEAKLKVLSMVAEQIPVSVIITDASGKIEYVNPNFSESTGYAASEVAGKSPSLLKSGVHGKGFYKALWDTIKSGRAWRGDICNRKKTGETYWEQRTIAPIKDGKGEITHFVSVQMDDIERRRAEAALKESEARYHMLLLTSLDAVVIADEKGVITECNGSAERMFGYAPGGLSGTMIEELMPGRMRASHRGAFKRFVSTGERRAHGKVLEVEGLRKNGEVFPLELVINSFRIGERLFITGTLRDITERKRIEGALKRSEEGLAEAQRIAHIGNWDWDIAGNSLYWSDEIYRIFGLKPQEFGATYEAFIDSVHPGDVELVKRSVSEALKLKRPYSIEHRIVLPDGEVRMVLERADVFFNENGEPVRMIGTVQDVTERKRMESELLKMQKLESIGILAGGIAHDYNNLLTGITGNAFLAKRGLPEGSKAIERLDAISVAAERASKLSQKLLTFSRGGVPVKRPADLAPVIAKAAESALSGSNVRLEMDVTPGLKPVEIDEGLMNQVFENLFLNARQAMKTGTVKVSVGNVSFADGEHAALPGGPYVKIVVSDGGPGIPDEDINRVFDPFFTTRPEGSGLGLAICHSIIRGHGGFITAEQGQEKGAVFSIYLPLPPGESARETGGTAEGRSASVKRPAKAGKETGPRTDVRRVLVMDDEALVREAAGVILEELGYAVSYVKDGREAIEAYVAAIDQGRPYDAVIMDLTIPGGMGGAEAVKRLLSIDPDARAIVSSGYSQDPVMSEYARYGFKGVIPKPYRVDELGNTVRYVIGR